MFKKGTILLLTIFCVSCSSVPAIKNQATTVSGEQVKYIYNDSKVEPSLKFINYNKSVSTSANHSQNSGIEYFDRGEYISIIKYVRLDSDHTFESTNEYKVRVEKTRDSILLTPYENIINQNAMLSVTYDIPVFSMSELIGILNSTKHEFKFEIDSKFPSDSINANFKRLASRDFSEFSSSENIYENSYYISLEEADVRVDIKTYPYRDGSKCSVSAFYKTKQTKSNTVSIKNIEESIKQKVSSIVNA